MSRYDPRAIRVRFVARHLIDSNNNIPALNRLRWRVHVVDNAGLANALVLPIGDIFLFSGLLDLAANPDQLAVILGHEVAHTILDHQAEDLSNDHLEDVIVAAPLTLVCAVLPSPLAAAIFQTLFRRCVDIFLNKPYSREMEREADRVGLFLAANACADLSESAAFWRRMRARRRAAELSDKLDFFSTHPSDSRRLELLERALPLARATWERKGCRRAGNRLADRVERNLVPEPHREKRQQ